MKYVDEFRDPRAARRLARSILDTATRRWVLMEVCGGQTHGLLRHGIEAELADAVELIHGPGCPVCVTPAEAIDFAQELAMRDGVLVATFGDMLRVPGNRDSLLNVRAAGGNVKAVYSPMDAVSLAQRHPDRHVVFFAVGFETTAPSTALAVLHAQRLKLDNFSLLVSHVRVLPAMQALMDSPGNRVQAFLAAGHVCTITGFAAYDEFVRRYRIPVAVTGFEPIDLLEGILECIDQLESGRAEVSNQYARSVRRAGNLPAQEIVGQVYEVSDRPWRGFGMVPRGGYCLRPEFSMFDAEKRFAGQRGTSGEGRGERLADTPPPSHAPSTIDSRLSTPPVCPAADVLAGRLRPTECAHFGVRCSPDAPLGAPMVSSEGACAAYFRYHPR